MTVTSNDIGHVALGDNVYKMVTLQFPQGDTYAEGTIMATKINSDTIAVAYTRAGTSDTTVVATPNAGFTLQTGDYVVTAGTMSSGAGVWTCVAPDGQLQAITTAASTDDLDFDNLGISMAVTETTSPDDWDTGDVITLTVAADGDTVIYDPDGTNGAQVPTGVLPYEKTVAAQSDVAASVIVGGKVNKNRLVIDDTTTVVDAHVLMLQDVGIDALPQDDLSTTDNIT